MKYALGNMLNGAGGLNPDGLALDLQFAADKTLTARRGPTPTFSRSSSGTFVNANGLIVGKTEGTTSSITPSTQTIGSQVTVTVASGSVVGWVIGQAISLIVDTDGQDDPDANELWLLGNIVAIGANTLTFKVTSRTTQTGSASSWTLGYRGPRFDHDPITPFACKGLLIEESRENLLKYSQEFENIAWGKLETTVSANSAVAPDGTTTADKLIPSVASNQHVVSSVITSAASPYTVTVYAKADGYNWIWFNSNGSGAITTDLCWFDVLNGVTGTAQAKATTSIQSMGNGWFRCVCSWGAFTVGTPSIWIGVSNGNNISSFAGDGTSGVLIWGAQIEAGAFATSYIPTTATALTRSADVCSITGASFTGMYNQAEGAMLVDAFTPASGIRNIVTCLAPFGKEVTLLTNVSAAELEVVDGVSQVNMSSGSPISPNTAFKLACAYKLNDFALTKNGVAPQTDTSGTVPTVNAMIVGSGPAGKTMCGCVSSLRYYRKRLSDAKIQTLTT